MTVQVLLSTYNGERYLRPQLESLFAQDYPHLTVLARDDGSQDGTLMLLQEYAARYPQVTVFTGENQGAARSFLHLVQRSSPTADYLAFCDQDDVWHHDKISRAVEWLRRCPSDMPALYCSRVAIVDGRLQLLRYSDMPKKPLSFCNALVECCIWGCTVVINAAARQLLLREMPQFLCMHDCWVYLVVSAFGTVLHDEEPHILYRRHGTNTSMIPVQTSDRWRVQLRHFWQHGKQRLVTRQAEEFLRIYGSLVSPDYRQIVERFLNSRQRLWDRLCYALDCDVYHQSILGHLMLRALIVLDRVHC